MNRYETYITPMKRRFWIAAALFLFTAMICVSQIKAKRLMENTHKELVQAKTGLFKVREASENRRKALATFKTGYLQNAKNTSAERLIYGKIDELNTRLRPDDLNISAIVKKDGEVSLQYTFKFINPNFNDFLNNISYLEGTEFPLSTVSTVSISQAEATGKSGLSCSISGKILTIEKSGQ